jgi:hypothetical protein
VSAIAPGRGYRSRHHGVAAASLKEAMDEQAKTFEGDGQ